MDGAVESSTFRAVVETSCIIEIHNDIIYSIVDDDYSPYFGGRFSVLSVQHRSYWLLLYILQGGTYIVA